MVPCGLAVVERGAELGGASVDGAAAAAPPAAPARAPLEPVEDRLRKLKKLHEDGLITKEEYERRRAEVINAR